ncbi:dedicator of cytokinesis protein 1 isoform X3 [Schistocerca gregaria]|uniref:dedicator of cytokinesis protein 1 isoform X3 n=1 Tax=Schistocerca gregaria TaxID=7010 RepID=UPI00211E58CC|nr:dedicator of cytokinesis protein 1 isoform X3 [Schistocerca gregaria]
MGGWNPVRESEKYGVAIHNFFEDKPYRIKLSVGETVNILEENGEWYFGYTTKNRALRGIFPKNYIHIKDTASTKLGNTDGEVFNQPQVVNEITSVLREWGQIWKNLYRMHSKNFKAVEHQILELLQYRSKILSGTLPVDELKELKQQVTSKIDMGNKMLDLDMVVRDKNGNILSPDITSTIQLYRQHEMATERIKKASMESEKPQKVVTHYSHIVFVSVRNFVCKMTEDAELLMNLYDANTNKAITENYVVRWSKEGLAKDIDQLYNLRVLFTDLGSRDLTRSKVYLVCYIIRIGAMEVRDIDHRRSSQVPKKLHAEGMRRPWGVAAMDITLFLCGKMESDEEKHHFIPFLQCAERDNLDGTLRRILLLKEVPQRDHKGHGLWISLKLLHGDIKQVREENPHLVLGNVAVARKMGFPEVILPGDVRNDLYLMLVSGEFSKGSKSTDKNVEVTVKVCNEKGQSIPGVITLGGGVEPLNEYRSVIYYHEDRPRWCEIFKVAIPIEEFKASHLKFTFKHRSSTEAKDKSEKPFAMSYVTLMQENGTTLEDSLHELLVYKIDHKKYEESELAYLSLPSRRIQLTEGQKPAAGGLSLSSKDSFTIETNVCSTKLTQNVDLLGLLNWASHPEGLKDSLAALMKVDGEEVVKFLQDVLDALFNILMENFDSELYDNMVFECLLFIIGLVSDRKYQHFQPVLDLYIQESFSATLAYNKLIVVLKYHIDNASSTDSQDKDMLLRTMKSLQYCMRFVVRSRQLFAELNEGKGQAEFETCLQQLLQSITSLMCYNTDSTLLVQGACLKYLPSTIPDILEVFSATQLSELLKELINKLPPNRLTKQKMMTVNDIVHSKLFLLSECRAILLPVITAQIKELLEARDEGRSGVQYRNKTKSDAKVAKVLGASKQYICSQRGSEEVELCVKILSDIMDLLFRPDIGTTIHDIKEIMLTVLRTVIQTVIAMDRDSPLVGNLVAVMISIFRQMKAHHFEVYISHFQTKTDLMDFLMEILLVFKDLVSRPVYPKDWSEMIMLQNSVILKSLRFFSHTIRDYFSQPFEHQAWNNFFHCAITFLTQPALQLDSFSQNKRSRIVARYKDMRRETGFEIRSMWFNLGQYKRQFVPGLVGPFLEMTLIPETELRKATIPIFFDMMQCEFYSSRHTSDSFGDTKRDSSHIKANFCEFEDEMIAKLDILVEGGLGDEHYKELFYEIMMELCKNHSTMHDQGTKFVDTVARLMERLLEYRCIITDENKENRMSCTVNLLDFYSEINRKEMYIRYVNKLCELHLECDNYTEAAFTLKLHSKLLKWSAEPLPPLLRSLRHPTCQTHRELKEALYYDIIHYFDKGKMWESALSICKELISLYEEETYDYLQLSCIHQRMSQFYDSIMKQIRPEPEYFRVAYYGRGFPAFLQNKVFVYRGKEYERLSDFSSRTINQLPNAELMNRLSAPSDDITESPHQYIQINKVEPVMDDRRKRFSGKAISDQIMRYFRVNDVQKFRFSRPFYRRDGASGDLDNEFANLWLERTVLVTSYPFPGILQWFPVISAEVYYVSPLQNAIETMEATNKSLKDLIVAHRADSTLHLNPLTMKIMGIVDAKVMGGIVNYEKAFFTDEYLESHPDDGPSVKMLKDLIAYQVPLLEIAIALHRQRAPPSLAPIQQRMEDCFSEIQSHVEEKYGKKVCDIKFDTPLQNQARRQLSGTSQTIDLHRLSGTSMASSEGSRSRVSSLTRSQVASLKSFATFNFSTMNSTNTLGRSTSMHQPASKTPVTSPTIGGPIFAKASGGTLKSKKDKGKDKRRTSNKAEKRESASQWYTSELDTVSNRTTPVFELHQELTPKRPLRSEVEKERRLSRPSSGQFVPGKFGTSYKFNSSGTSSNRDSVGTTDSTASEEDMVPPPLPMKVRNEPDYCNLPDTGEVESETKHTLPSVPRVDPKPPRIPEPTDRNTPPPTPPPKRPHLKLPIS